EQFPEGTLLAAQKPEQDRPRLVATRLRAHVQQQRIVDFDRGHQLAFDDWRQDDLVPYAAGLEQDGAVAFRRGPTVPAAQIAIHAPAPVAASPGAARPARAPGRRSRRA